MAEPEFQIGDVVQIQCTSDFPIGGWLHGELAVVCGGSYSQKMLIVKLKNKLLREAVEQDDALRGTVNVSFANVSLVKK